VWPVVLVGIMVASVIGFAMVLASTPTAAPAKALPEIPGSPTHFGHPMIPASAPGSSAAATSGPLGCPLASTECYSSDNWGGYAVEKSSYKVSAVFGSWVVPTIANVVGSTCADSQTTWESNSVWIGIDGFSDGTVEQTGTSSDCFYGTVNYYAWYEFYPSASVVASFAVSPGDSITAKVLYSGPGTNATGPLFTTTLTDKTTGSTLTSPKTGVVGALRDSAEWIDESPYYMGYLGLTHVNQVRFTGASATIGGVNAPINGWGTNQYWLLMVDYNFPSTLALSSAKAQPSALTSSGGTFTVKWLSYGP
jgi:hypothetical protein